MQMHVALGSKTPNTSFDEEELAEGGDNKKDMDEDSWVAKAASWVISILIIVGGIWGLGFVEGHNDENPCRYGARE
jgi:hypothetical protein